MKKIVALFLVLALSITALVGCGAKDYTLSIGVASDAKAATTKVADTVATIVTDADGKIVLCRLDCIEYTAQVNGAISTDVTASKVNQGEDYDKDNYMKSGDWYKQAAEFESYVIGKTQAEVKAIVTDNAGKVADLEGKCTIGVSDFLKAIDKAFESEHKVSFKASGTLTLGLSAIGSAKNTSTDTANSAKYTAEFAGVVLEDGKVAAAILDTAETEFKNVTADGAESIGYKGTKREQGDAYDAYDPMDAGRWYQQADAYCAAAVGLTKDNIANLASEGVAGCTIYSGGYKAGIEAAVKAAR